MQDQNNDKHFFYIDYKYVLGIGKETTSRLRNVDYLLNNTKTIVTRYI